MKIKNVLLIVSIMLFFSVAVNAQQKTPMVRIAKLQIDPAQLESYKAILKEEIEASIRLEPGVLTFYAVSEQKNPASITIFETYASVEAYQLHIKSPQFIKYKTSTEKMVKSLELVPCDPIALGKK
jgi:quinol monooxygenase YgiN